MGQSWQRPAEEPRLGRLEVWVERARNLAPELKREIAKWADARVQVVVMLQGRREESERKVSVGVVLFEDGVVCCGDPFCGWRRCGVVW